MQTKQLTGCSLLNVCFSCEPNMFVVFLLVPLENCSSVMFNFVQVTSDVAHLLGEHKVDAILCVAGGWAGGNCSSKGQR